MNFSKDRVNCGGCMAAGEGERCPSNKDCVNGKCELVCTAPAVKCGDACVDFSKD
ncbi:MAG: hypothetical protein WC966_09240 [Bradymonadales bacterium]